jgi:hypothetical protein
VDHLEAARVAADIVAAELERVSAGRIVAEELTALVADRRLAAAVARLVESAIRRFARRIEERLDRVVGA